jgi:hypothetical protein
MLQAFKDIASGRVAMELIEGRWPDVAAATGRADVAVCANVAYNVSALGPFIEALTSAARGGVVLELTAVHPQSALSPLWAHFWGLSRPTGPTAYDAEAVIREVTGVRPEVHRWRRAAPFFEQRGPQHVAWIRRRLCLPPASDEAVAAALDKLPELAPSAMVTFCWPGQR